MAPVTPDLNNVQDSIKNTLSDIFTLLSNLSTAPTPQSQTAQSLASSITTLDRSLLQVYNTASALQPQNNPGIPLPLMEYVENGRNPDIYTREFVELVRRLNQLQRGKSHAFRDFRDVLAGEMSVAMPELREDVERVVDATGGRTAEGR
ncbi:putative mediator of RNA polymerase II transcription subunit 10 [Cladorrhinum sp. PSN259]|nr:putative mediator of RNA polymerase II transcription subunit 10 [Cladorrhinum sp. PSN259]